METISLYSLELAQSIYSIALDIGQLVIPNTTMQTLQVMQKRLKAGENRW